MCLLPSVLALENFTYFLIRFFIHFVRFFQDKIRRFRVKFASSHQNGSGDCIDQCNDFISNISAYVNVQRISEKNAERGSKQSSGDVSIISVGSLTEVCFFFFTAVDPD